MDSEKASAGELKKDNFFRYVFNFDDESKAEFLNAIQYALLSIIPVVTLNKTVARFIPEADDKKGSFEILGEVIGQAALLFVGMILIHRIISYIPTYSNVDYRPFHVTNIILVFLTIMLSLQSRIGEKTNILLDRLMDLVTGETTLKKKEVVQKQGQMHQQQVMVQQHQASRADQPNTQNPQTVLLNQMHQGGAQQATSGPITNQPNFNSMYQGPQNHLVNAATPGVGREPMAANELGGGFSSF